mmetsp:Transcript_25471/g.64172  ORF Transcript_25471/g.64172 Transcript_25471/m.64172 type:complete len:279 (+) Transcript_25471:943-1779(+)
MSRIMVVALTRSLKVGGALTPQTEPKIMPLMSDGLNRACVRFDRDGEKPTHKLYQGHLNGLPWDLGECDIFLPREVCSTRHRDSNWDSGIENATRNAACGDTGTEVVIDRSISGMMIIPKPEPGHGYHDGPLIICGARIYGTTTTTTTTTGTVLTTTTTTTTTPQRYETVVATSRASEETEESNVGKYVGITFVVVLVLVLAVLACVGVGIATGAIGGGSRHHLHRWGEDGEDWASAWGEWQEGADESWGGNADWNAYAGPSGYDVDTHSGHQGHSGH